MDVLTLPLPAPILLQMDLVRFVDICRYTDLNIMLWPFLLIGLFLTIVVWLAWKYIKVRY